MRSDSLRRYLNQSMIIARMNIPIPFLFRIIIASFRLDGCLLFSACTTWGLSRPQVGSDPA
jgi:hypothetical protein